LKANTRPSSRPLHATRPTTILPSTITRNTAGSALIRIGETRVLAGTTLYIGKPSPNHPNCGDISIQLDMGPICGPKYNSSNRIPSLEYKWNASHKQQGLDKHKAIESWITRTLLHPSRHSKTKGSILDLEQLGIEEHKSAWRIVVSIMVLNYDGNIEDAAFLAAVAALKDTVLPPVKTVRDVNGNEILALDSDFQDMELTALKEVKMRGKQIQLDCIPIPLTVGLFIMNDDEKENYKILVDPTGQEEEVLDGIMSIVVGFPVTEEANYDLSSNHEINILSVNKPGGKVVVTPKDIAACMHLCQGRAQELVPVITQIE